MKVLKYITPDLAMRDSIAIVGSSGCLLGKNHGQLINSYEEVVRFNRAPTQGYEEVCGSKTTLRVSNNHVFFGHKPKQFYENQPPDFIKNLRDTKILFIGPDEKIAKAQKNTFTHPTNTLYTFRHVNANDVRKEFKYPSPPSVGLIFVFLTIMAGLKPTLFGFDTNLEDSSRTHYWEKRCPAGPMHRPDNEKKFLNQLAESGQIELYK